MRVLHLFSNFKWTGPAEPAVELVRRLRSRGVAAELASSVYAKGSDSRPFVEEARARGIEPILRFELPKHFAPVRALRDARALGQTLDQDGIDLLHAHLRGDHLVAALATRRSRNRPPIVRSLYDAEPRVRGLRDRWLVRRTRLLLVPSRGAARALERSGASAEAIRVVEPGVDLSRFDPERELPDARPSLGLHPEDFAVGVAARVQRRRRFDLVLRAVAEALPACSRLRLVVLGRGTHLDAVAREPARRAGLERVVLFPGFRTGSDYLAALAALDAFVLLAPGTDGTARAVREAMAMGKPCVVSDRGLLPELVEHGRTGFVCPPNPAAIAGALLELAGDPRLRRSMGSEAAATARSRFDSVAQAGRVEALYREVLGRGAEA